jgi:hypothetical protein
MKCGLGVPTRFIKTEINGFLSFVRLNICEVKLVRYSFKWDIYVDFLKTIDYKG